MRAIVVVRSDQLGDVHAALAKAEAVATEIPLANFSPADFMSLARQLCLQWSPEVYASVRSHLSALFQRFGTASGWSGDVLDRVSRVCQAYAR